MVQMLPVKGERSCEWMPQPPYREYLRAGTGGVGGAGSVAAAQART